MLIKVFQGGDIAPAAHLADAMARGVQKLAGGVHQDAFAFPQELTQVMGKARAELYRPLKWRRYIPVEGVDSWAQRIEDRKYTTKVGNPVLASNKGPTQELPMPSFTVGNQFLPIFEFMLAYGYTERDVELAAHIGQSLPTENISACNLGFEQYLETVASVGHTGNGVTMFGLGNLADVGSATAVTKAAGGTTWAVATAAEIAEDLNRIVNAVETASLETSECNLIVLPVAQYQKASTTFTSALQTTALDLFHKMSPGVTVAKWNRLSNQGAGSTPCAMGWDTRDPYGPRMLMQKEATYGTPLRGTNGWLVPGKIATGGVRCINPSAVIKMSGL